MSVDITNESLADPSFDPDAIVLDDAFPWEAPRTADHAQDPPTISVGINPAVPEIVYLSIDPPGEAVLAREIWMDLRLTRGVWVDLEPADALELARRLRVCAEAAIRFAAFSAQSSTE